MSKAVIIIAIRRRRQSLQRNYHDAATLYRVAQKSKPL